MNKKHIATIGIGTIVLVLIVSQLLSGEGEQEVYYPDEMGQKTEVTEETVTLEETPFSKANYDKIVTVDEKTESEEATTYEELLELFGEPQQEGTDEDGQQFTIWEHIPENYMITQIIVHYQNEMAVSKKAVNLKE